MWLTAVAILLSLPLMLVGLRVLGETNWGPISQLTNMMQVIFGAIAPGNLTVNMVVERHDRHDRRRVRSADAGLQGRLHDRLDAEEHDDHAAASARRSAPRPCRGCIRCFATRTASSASTPGCRRRSRAPGRVCRDSVAGFRRAAGRRRARAVRRRGARHPVHRAGGAQDQMGAVADRHGDRDARARRRSSSSCSWAAWWMWCGAAINRAANEAYLVPLASGLIAGEAIVAVVIPLLVALGVIQSMKAVHASRCSVLGSCSCSVRGSWCCVRFAWSVALGAQPRSTGRSMANGNALVRPANYREWVFLGAGLGMTYDASAAGTTFTNVFVNPAAYRGFMNTGRWPDKSVFVLEFRASATEAPPNTTGRFQTRLVGIEAEVKDARFPDGWAFYNFRGADSAAAARRSGRRVVRRVSLEEYGCRTHIRAVLSDVARGRPRQGHPQAWLLTAKTAHARIAPWPSRRSTSIAS